jgi:hypothetical protein
MPMAAGGVTAAGHCHVLLLQLIEPAESRRPSLHLLLGGCGVWMSRADTQTSNQAQLSSKQEPEQEASLTTRARNEVTK